jgi:hypothetical protein
MGVKMYRTIAVGVMGVLLVFGWCVGRPAAAERKAKEKAAESDPDDAPLPGEKPGAKAKDVDKGEKEDVEKEEPLLKKKSSSTKNAAGKDPVEAAFALPKGVKLDNLSHKQKDAYEKLKADKGPALRDAMDKMKSGSSEEKRTAGKDIKKLREDIKVAIYNILTEEAQKAAAEAAKHKPPPQQRPHRR